MCESRGGASLPCSCVGHGFESSVGGGTKGADTTAKHIRLRGQGEGDPPEGAVRPYVWDLWRTRLGLKHQQRGGLQRHKVSATRAIGRIPSRPLHPGTGARPEFPCHDCAGRPPYAGPPRWRAGICARCWSLWQHHGHRHPVWLQHRGSGGGSHRSPLVSAILHAGAGAERNACATCGARRIPGPHAHRGYYCGVLERARAPLRWFHEIGDDKQELCRHSPVEPGPMGFFPGHVEWGHELG